MDFRLFTNFLLVAIVFRPENQNLKIDVSDVFLEIDNDNDLSWLTQSSPSSRKVMEKIRIEEIFSYLKVPRSWVSFF